MLSVSFDLAVLAAMLFGIVLSANPKEIDSLNSTTTRPIPGGNLNLVIARPYVKRGEARFCSYLHQQAMALYQSP